MKSLLAKISSALLLWLTVCQTLFVQAKNPPDVPSPQRLVNDYAGVLNPQDAGYLEQKLRKYADTTSTQITIVLENSLEGDDAFDYSFRLAEKWGIGQKGKNNGLLVYAAIADHKIRIQVGYGLEGAITDAISKRIIQEIIVPAFKQGNYAKGLDDGTSALILAARGEFKAGPKGKNGGGTLALVLVFAAVFFIISLLSKFNRVRNSHIGSDLSFWTILMLMNSGGGRRSGGSSWGDFSGGGGDFGGFGGGSFGGGGAGGDW